VAQTGEGRRERSVRGCALTEPDCAEGLEVRTSSWIEMPRRRGVEIARAIQIRPAKATASSDHKPVETVGHLIQHAATPRTCVI